MFLLPAWLVSVTLSQLLFNRTRLLRVVLVARNQAGKDEERLCFLLAALLDLAFKLID